MNVKRATVAASALAVASLGLIVPASATHGPNCDQPREDVVAFLQDNMDEWNVYDRDDDGVACETTHALTEADVQDQDDSEVEETEDTDDAEDTAEDNGDDSDVETPTEIDTGR